jgi:hypothetical protein
MGSWGMRRQLWACQTVDRSWGAMTTATLIDPINIYVVWDAADAEDAAWAKTLADSLDAALTRIIGGRLTTEDCPQVRPVAAFENIPLPDELGPLSVLLLVLPARERGFGTLGEDRLRRIRDDDPDPKLLEARTLPIGRLPGRLPPPAPIDGIVGIHAVDLTPAKIEEIARTALINVSLGLSSRQRRVFISYRQRDGMAVAKRLQDRLQERGYNVWRDDMPDRDGMAKITPGSDAQRTIQAAIVEQSFILLVDTPEAPNSPWVREEVALAFGYLLPILPVVVDSPSDRPSPGGRFLNVGSLGREARLETAALGAASHAEADRLVDAHVDEIERQVTDILLGHLRSRRRLVYESRRRFQNLQFVWKDHAAVRLLFEVEKGLAKPLAPALKKRYLVRCSPYGRLIRHTVDGLCDAYTASAGSFNYALLVHNAVAYYDHHKDVIADRGYVVLLRPYEILVENLP